MLTLNGHLLVLWIHVLAACVWIGGQITVAALLPIARRTPGLPALVGRRFQLIAWPAFAVLILSGLLNIAYRHITWNGLWNTDTGHTLALKLALVMVSGGAAATHVVVVRSGRLTVDRTRAASIILGILSLLSALVAALMGVVLHGG